MRQTTLTSTIAFYCVVEDKPCTWVTSHFRTGRTMRSFVDTSPSGIILNPISDPVPGIIHSAVMIPSVAVGLRPTLREEGSDGVLLEITRRSTRLHQIRLYYDGPLYSSRLCMRPAPVRKGFLVILLRTLKKKRISFLPETSGENRSLIGFVEEVSAVFALENYLIP